MPAVDILNNTRKGNNDAASGYRYCSNLFQYFREKRKGSHDRNINSLGGNYHAWLALAAINLRTKFDELTNDRQVNGHC